MKTHRRIFVALALCAAAWSGCSSSSVVETYVTHPAEINTAPYRRAVVAGFKNLTLVPNLQDRIENALTNALLTTGRYDVVDRSVYNRFASQGDTRDDMMVITGAVTVFKVDDDIRRGKPFHDSDDKDKERMHVNVTRVTNLRYAVEFNVSRASDATIIAAREIPRELSDERTARDEEPRRLDPEEMAHQAETDITNAFVSKLLPRREKVRLHFFTEDTFPELDKGIDEAAHGKWAAASEIFDSATTRHRDAKGELLAKAYYDLGLAREFNHNWAGARAAFQRAIQLDGSTSVYGRALSECGARESDYNAWLSQHWE